MLQEFQTKTNIEILGFKLIYFGFPLVLSDKDLRNIDLLDTHLDLLHTNIPNKTLFSLQDILETSSRHALKTSSRHVFKTSCLQQSNFSSSKTFSRRPAICLQDVFKAAFNTKNCYAEDVLKTSSRHAFKRSSRPLEDQHMFVGIYLYLGIPLSFSFVTASNLFCWKLSETFFLFFDIPLLNYFNLSSSIFVCLFSEDINLSLGISLSCSFVTISEFFSRESFETFVILIAILLPIKLLVASAFFWIAVFQAVLNAFFRD